MRKHVLRLGYQLTNFGAEGSQDGEEKEVDRVDSSEVAAREENQEDNRELLDESGLERREKGSLRQRLKDVRGCWFGFDKEQWAGAGHGVENYVGRSTSEETGRLNGARQSEHKVKKGSLGN